MVDKNTKTKGWGFLFRRINKPRLACEPKSGRCHNLWQNQAVVTICDKTRALSQYVTKPGCCHNLWQNQTVVTICDKTWALTQFVTKPGRCHNLWQCQGIVTIVLNMANGHRFENHLMMISNFIGYPAVPKSCSDEQRLQNASASKIDFGKIIGIGIYLF